jgi:hypothetical protein
MKNLHKVDGAEMFGIIIRKLTENWEKLCDEYLEEGEYRPDFKVLTTTQYIIWSKTNVINNVTLINGDCVDEKLIDEALYLACNQVDDLTLKGYPILDDIVIKCNNDDNDVAEYGKMYTIIAENLATMMVDIHNPELLLDYLYLCQKICIGRYLYEIRDIITDNAMTGAEMLGELNNFAICSQRESMKIDKSDPLGRFDVVTYDRKAIEYVGVDIDQIRSVFKSYNETIEKSRTFYVTDEIYNS